MKNQFIKIIALSLLVVSCTSQKESLPSDPEAKYEVILSNLDVSLDIVPQAINFGISSGNEIVETINIKNTSLIEKPLNLSIDNDEGSTAFKIRINRCGESLGAGKSCKITMSFSPRGIFDGVHTASFLIADEVVVLSSTIIQQPDPYSTGTPNLTVSVQSKFLSNLQMWTRTITIKNVGDGTAKSMAIQIPAGYILRLSRCPSDLKPGKSCSYMISNREIPETQEIVITVGGVDNKEINPITGTPTIPTTPSQMRLTAVISGSDPIKNLILPLNSGVSVHIDWGDGGSVQQYTSNNPSHTYAAAGTYKIKIYGTALIYGGAVTSTNPKIKSVESFGDLGLTSLNSAFSGANTLIKVPATIPPTVTNLALMFQDCTIFNDPSVTSWDITNVTTINQMFRNAPAFNQPLNWNTTNVTNMAAMFYQASSFNQLLNFSSTAQVTGMNGMFYFASAFNRPVNFDTSNVTTMASMFYGAASFNHPLTFNTSKVTTMNQMFREASVFDSPINFNDTSKVTNFAGMFNSALIFNRPVSFDTSSATTLEGMFYNTEKFNQPLNFNTGNVLLMNSMFEQAFVFNQNLNWNTAKVTAMNAMFYNAKEFNGDVTFSDTSKVTTMNSMFYNAEKFNRPVNFNTVSVTNINGMFRNAKEFNQVINFNGENLTTATNMFRDAISFNQTVTLGNTSKLLNLLSMFSGATVFNQNISMNTSNVTNMSNMFQNAEAFNSASINNWPVFNVVNMDYMFNNAFAFNRPISNWNTSKVTSMKGTFFRAERFNQPLYWDVSSVTDMDEMFLGALDFNQTLNWNTINVTNMRRMFAYAVTLNSSLVFKTNNVTNMEEMFRDNWMFNRDLSQWCVAQILTEPILFKENTVSWVAPKPIWGTCAWP